MSKYPYKHQTGSVVYKVENYRFQFRSHYAADIEILDVPNENTSFQFKIVENKKLWGDLPSELLERQHAGNQELKPFGCELIFYPNKHEAIQAATDTIEKILDKYKTSSKFD
ncbi:hypothetical protein CEY02_19600 [Bacillus pumilus]|uniref:Uncharacterized protein n=1 Tax=Bacillus pumilus TaxID=1408 RepID=A0A2A5IKW1_BACPU|nr:hypothetical protein [Bacillus pumilus]PCK17732.1 hypothetical protein CEY02_19600 [Bacillus pumilus]